MKLQAHLPTVRTGARDWRAATIALVSLLAASILVFATQSGALLNNLLIGRPPASSSPPARISAAHPVSLDLHSPNDLSGGFSVARALPATVASPQRFSIGVDQRAAFELFGESALRGLSAGDRAAHQLAPRNDRMLLMLMWLRLHTHRS